jgi:catechol 2,3-dioxygenase-like lactoylglutathione lyase family enzyme
LRFYRDTIGVEGAVREESYGFVITTAEGVSFTLFEGQPPNDHGEFHVGVCLANGDAVREKRQALHGAGVPEVEWWDEPGYVSMKVRDPDGYAVEIAWDETYANT